MKYRKSLLIMLAGAMLCSACAKNSGNSEVSDVVQGTSSYAVSTEGQSNNDGTSNEDNSVSDAVNKADAWISLIEPQTHNYYYAAEHQLETDEAEQIYDGSWCLAENGIYYVTNIIYDDYVEGKLNFISYDDIAALDNKDNLLLGSLERGGRLAGFSREIAIDVEGYGEAVPDCVSAYDDGAALMAHIREEQNDKDLIIYLDGDNNIVKTVDVTEQEKTVQQLMQEEIEWAGTTKVQVFAGETGDIICSSYEERKKSILCFYTEDSTEVKKIVTDDYSIGNVIYDGTGSLYWLHGGTDGQKIVRYDINTGETSEGSFDGMDESAYIYNGTAKPVLWSQNGIYQLDISAGTLFHVMNWNEAGVKNGIYDRMRIMPDGSIYAAKLAGGVISLCLLQESDVAVTDEKTVLKLAVTRYSSSDFGTLVRNFNASNSMYKVELVKYDDSYSFITSMTAKDGADMMSTDIIDMAQFAEKGYTADLYEFLDSADSVVKKDDILEGIRNVYTFDGSLAALPVTFSTIVLFGGDEFNAADWDVDEFVKLIARNDKAVTNFMGNYIDYRYDLVYIYWSGMKDRLVDWKNMEAHFDTDEFVGFLNALKAYKLPMPTENDSTPQAKYWSDDQIYLFRRNMGSPYELQLVRKIMGNDNPVILGFPTEDGSAFPINSGNSIAISAKSNNKEGAWQFIQYALKNSDVITKTKVDMQSFPVYIPLLNELLDEAMVKTYERDQDYEILLDKDGEPVEKQIMSYIVDQDSVSIYAMDEADRESLWYIFDNIGMINDSSPTTEIFDEELTAFIEGTQTAEQTARILQDRMTLMLEE